ncbi:MAG: sigma-54-dependent Fis family transcriptional regulator [Deltaproteobacteria bacterium]|nr:sigma-54-dependent Fis family transcriptional regulator [Deltaproteobacteria bacterium]
MEDATLVVCSDPTERAAYSGWLRADGYRVAEVSCTGDALTQHRRGTFPLTVAELAARELDGIELMRAIRATKPEAEFLMLGSGESVGSAVAAMKAGAADLLLKPIRRTDFMESVHKIWTPRLRPESRQLENELRSRFDFSEIVARSPQMLHVLAIAARVAPRDTTVLLTGESGTGKELMARAIHRNSARASRGMTSINCAAIPEALLESELFGYRKGAFTGADCDKPGLLATADGGTLFLDEIAELPLTTQAKLLRFIQEGTFFPVGSPLPSTADVRIISATNAPLAQRVEAETFRRDLYYRLSVFPLHVPPLRERPEDIVPLAQHFLARLERQSINRVPGLSREVVHYLTARSWHGNVRELESAIERAVILSDGSLLTSADFRQLDMQPGSTAAVRRLIELPETGIDLPELNRSLVVEALARTNQNVSAAARLLSLSRPALRYRMKKYGFSVR